MDICLRRLSAYTPQHGADRSIAGSVFPSDHVILDCNFATPIDLPPDVEVISACFAQSSVQPPLLLPAESEIRRGRPFPLGSNACDRAAWVILIDNFEVLAIVNRTVARTLKGAVRWMIACARANYHFFDAEGNDAKDVLMQDAVCVRCAPDDYLLDVIMLALWAISQPRDPLSNCSR
jgi:hypothetical protein